ncbi:MAG: M6 family metalloprotease domain-containing protein [Endomicrobium sp.]|jgi:M6 family metalloprotease-like protein|nr:M6 family metalloprotease domain-containing protein [Endomicrobium sp.]
MKITLTINRFVKIFFIAAFAFFAALSLSFAEPAYPGPIEVEQPDGTKVTVRLFGDEFYHWAEDTQGYTVVQDSRTREWVYAQQDAAGALKPTSARVGRASPQALGLTRRLKDRDFAQIRSRNMDAMKLPEPLKVKKTERRQAFSSGESQEVREESFNPLSQKNLVVLVAFSDKPFVTPNPQQSFDNLLNQTGYSVNGAAGSVRDFFLAASYGSHIVDSVVTHVITADKTSAYYAGSMYDNVPELVREVVKKLDDQGFNFRQCSSNGTELDCLTIIYAGRGQATGGGPGTIWPHAYSINRYTTRDGIEVSRYNCSNELRHDGFTEKMVGSGTIVHEISHALFGLPDLYDTSSSPTHEGVGEFCLMSSGNHSGNGYTPTLWSAWCKQYLGISIPVNLPDNADVTILDSALNDNNIYKFKGPQFYSGSGEEYFLIENRNGGGFDKGLPQPSAAIGRGLLIWHIDESRRNNNSANAARLMVGLEEADGRKNLINSRRPTGVYFKKSSNAAYNFTSFTDDTNPDSRSYDGYLAEKPITLISAPGESMTFRVGNGGTPLVTGVINSVTPAEGRRGLNNVNVTINGTNFLAGSTVKLVKSGSSAITASAVTYVSENRLSAVFNIPGNAAAGYWNMAVSSAGYVSDIIKTEAFLVLGNTMSINNVSPDIGIRGTTLSLSVTGTDFQSGASVKLTNEIRGISAASVSRSGTTAITASFAIPSGITDGTKFDLTVTNANGDYAVKTQAVTIYNPLTVTNFSPVEVSTGSPVDLTVNGAGFKDGYAKIILKDASNENRTIIPSVISADETRITAAFTAPASSGTWKVYVAAYDNGPEYAAASRMSIVTDNVSTHDLLANTGAVIMFQVKSKDGAQNTGRMVISEGTFGERIKVSVRQHGNLAHPHSHVRELKHTNIGVHIDTEGKLPGKEIELRIPYNESDIEETGEENLVISRFDEENSAWVPLKSAVNKANKHVTAYIEHLSVFAIMGASVSAKALEDVRYYPNPIQPSKGLNYARMNFSNMPAGTRIKIYTMLGQIVRTMEADASGMAVWDGRNDSGDNAASGVYIAYMEDGGGNKKRIKIALER